MRRIKELIAVVAISVLSLVPCCTHAAPEDTAKVADMARKMEISLLTCAPGQEVYSLYGHTAIKVDFHANDTAGAVNDEAAAVVNYGMFSFHKPYFILRFIFGLTDYEMGITDEDAFCGEYRSEGRSVIQQTLNLTSEEKAAVWLALSKNYQPENRVYRYNYFYDNCTTRARDILAQCIKGRVVYADSGKVYPTYRELIHSMNGDWPWARFGNDILLGVRADRKTDVTEQQFLPFNLMRDFDRARIEGTDGSVRPLVKSKTVIVKAESIVTETGFPLTPRQCAWLLFAVVAALTAVEWLRGGNYWMLDTLLMTTAGCAGIVLFLMLFSQHPTTSTNLQFLLLNPVPLLMVWRVTKNMRHGCADRFWKCAAAVIVVFLICGIWQDYAEGMTVLALSLLLRCGRRQFQFSRKK